MHIYGIDDYIENFSNLENFNCFKIEFTNKLFNLSEKLLSYIAHPSHESN